MTDKGYVVAPKTGEADWVLGSLIEWKAVGGRTGGRLTAFEMTARKGASYPKHFHTREDEAFYVLDGEVTFDIDGELIDAAPGSFAYVPRSAAHTAIIRSESARMLVLFMPSGIEAYYSSFGEPAGGRGLGPPPDEPLPLARMRALDEELGIVWVDD
jgi:quercetin dioxygenase-like cupin family protein